MAETSTAETSDHRHGCHGHYTVIRVILSRAIHYAALLRCRTLQSDRVSSAVCLVRTCNFRKKDLKGFQFARKIIQFTHSFEASRTTEFSPDTYFRDKQCIFCTTLPFAFPHNLLLRHQCCYPKF